MKKQIHNFTNDEIRKKILEFLDQKRKKARSLSSIQATVTDIKTGLKSFGISQGEVVINLDYLVQNNWVKEEKEKKTFTTPRGFSIPSESRHYRLSDSGIKFIEGGSVFDNSSSFSGINITNIGGVTAVGNNNVVRNEYFDVFQTLDRLENGVKISEKITDEQKLNAISDIRTIKDQLSKPTPNKDIIKDAMNALMFFSSIPGLVDLFNQTHNLIEKVF